MKFFRTPYFVLLFMIRFFVYLYRRFRRRSIKTYQPLRVNVETLPLLDHHLPCPEAKRQLLKERTRQYPEHVKPTRTEKGEVHQLVWPKEVVKKTCEGK
jgi:hypothetical protein